MVNTHCEVVDEGPVYEFFCNKMVLFVTSFWFSLTSLVFALFRALTGYLFRFLIDDTSQKKISGSCEVIPLENDRFVSYCVELEDIPELEVVDHGDAENDGAFDDEKETTPEFTFKFHFQFPRYEDASSANGDATTTATTSGPGDLKATATTSGNGDLKASTSKYEFVPNNYCSGFVEEPVGSFVVREMFSDPNRDTTNDKEILDDGFLSEKFFLENKVDSEEMMNNPCCSEDSEKPESVVLTEVPSSEMEQSVDLDRSNTIQKEEFNDEPRFLSENDLVSSDSEPEAINLWDKFSVMVDRMDSSSDGFLSDGDFDGAAEPEIVTEVDERKAEPIRAFQNSEEVQVKSPQMTEQGDVEITTPTSPVQRPTQDEPTDSDDIHEMFDDMEKLEEFNLPNSGALESDAEVESELQKIQAECEQELNLPNLSTWESDAEVECELEKIQAEYEQEEVDLRNSSTPESDVQVEHELQKIQAECDQVDNLPNSSTPESDAHVEHELQKIQAECDEEDSAARERNKIEDTTCCGIPEEPSLHGSSYDDYEDSSNLETLWEHQDLIEQLKMEIRKVRATGLPTIFEESESPRMSEVLKPLKIDEKVVHEDQINGLHKFHSRYNERMRKFDILNYQKRHTIGILKLEDPLQSISTLKSSGSTRASLLSQNILLPKRRKVEEDASVTFLRELESDLEQVYVGQLCLSWEFLHWEYGKARELLESDPYEVRPYNHVAGEFQQFQVLLQRFVENEPFQEPRVQSYTKKRCDIRNLLQVPLIREDPVDKEGRKRSKDAITCSMLLDIIEESMRVFWEFVRADKHDAPVILKGPRPHVKFVDPEDTDLFVEIQTSLQKKEKKVKDILRSGNCLVKKFQKQHKEKSDELLLFSQIDLKLVSRVLRMSRLTTAELTWCQEKLNRISFVQRKIRVENSFLLFPC